MKTQMKPEIGMGVTYCIGSDRYPCTISKVVNDRQIEVQADEFRADVGHDYYGNQKWIIIQNPDGTPTTLTLRKNGRWVQAGETMNSSGLYRIGERDAYQDPSF